jgi:hypothetical protein
VASTPPEFKTRDSLNIPLGLADISVEGGDLIMSIGSISANGPLLDNISADTQGPSINQIAALRDSNQAEASAALQLIQSVGQASSGRLSVYA